MSKPGLVKRGNRALQRLVLKYALQGSNVYCPICKTGFITFLPYGLNRANALCPKCGSLERTRLFWVYMNRRVENFLNTPKKVLHVAPESVLFKIFSKSQAIDYYPIDKFTKGWRYPKGTLEMDITELKIEDNFFDFILCSHVLEHVPNDVKAMNELYRVLKPGGWGILQVPIEMNRPVTYEDASIVSPEERLIAFGQFDHVRIYGFDYIKRLESAGFKVIVHDEWGKLTPSERFKLGLLPGEDLFVVEKM